MRVNDKIIDNYDHLQIIKRASQEISLFLIEKFPSNLNDKVCVVSADENSLLPAVQDQNLKMSELDSKIGKFELKSRNETSDQVIEKDIAPKK